MNEKVFAALLFAVNEEKAEGWKFNCELEFCGKSADEAQRESATSETRGKWKN